MPVRQSFRLWKKGQSYVCGGCQGHQDILLLWRKLKLEMVS